MTPGTLLRADRKVLVGGALLLALGVIALLAPLAGDPDAVSVYDRLQGPSVAHPMGTDQLGRDHLSRVLHAARVSYVLAVLVVAVKVAFGTFVGIVAGYVGGWVDGVLMRIVDVFLAFPNVVLALTITVVLGPSAANLVIALIAVGWDVFARLSRSAVLTVRHQPFIPASVAIGATPRAILRRHVLPHTLTAVVAYATIDMGNTILAMASLSFLGLGVQPPTAEWGSMLGESARFLEDAPHLMIFPGLLVVLSVLAFNLVGDGLRDQFDVRIKAAG